MLIHLIVIGALLAGLFVSAACAADTASDQPLTLHPDNPHYFLFHGKPTVIIGSGEHYGAVLNRKFDYVKYLDTLAADGLNHTRLFSGAYCEKPGAFNIASNTLAPAPGDLLCPWARSDESGYVNGGNKFDLTKFDDAYFARLKDFVAQAGKRGVIVEMNLFCPFYEDSMWQLSPMNAANNINGIGQVGREDAYTLDHDKRLLAVQGAMVRKIVTELNGFDNVYYEVCNEPYWGKVRMDWQDRMVDVIVETERGLLRTHLISLNIANGTKRVEKAKAGVSIFNFHYASPPVCVADNWHLNRPIGDNETGFKGTGDAHYRTEAWEFMLAGGALYSNLDYSFTVGHEDGTFKYPHSQPGGGNPEFRRQLGVLVKFMLGLDFVKMKPDGATMKGLPSGMRARCLSQLGKQYAIYLIGEPADMSNSLKVDLPRGNYHYAWIDVMSGRMELHGAIEHAGGEVVVPGPGSEKTGEIAVKITAE